MEENYIDETTTGLVGFSGETEIDESHLEISVTQQDIVNAIKICLDVSPLINKNNRLVSIVYQTLNELYLKDKKTVILECPTGSGKTIIGFMIFFCTQYLKKLSDGQLKEYEKTTARVEAEEKLSYFLTSSKILQEQIDNDLPRFDFRDYISILKGTDNYECIRETETVMKMNNGVLPKNFQKITYKNRPCKGVSSEDLKSQFGDCFERCPYRCARNEAATKANSVLNYAYFLNVLRNGNSIFFEKRLLTICDEAHLIPDIVCNTFNFEFTRFLTNQINSFIDETAHISHKLTSIDTIKTAIAENIVLFAKKLEHPTEMLKYFDNIAILGEEFNILSKNESLNPYKQKIAKIQESIGEVCVISETYKKLVSERLYDAFFESEEIESNYSGMKIYKHIVKDLSEPQMCREHFIDKTHKSVMMSATLGNVDDFGKMLGLEQDEFSAFKLDSDFDFSQSEIFLCNSGYLNFANFKTNIDKVIMDCLKICNQLHPNHKGIIHTSTFAIAKLLQEKIELGLADRTRFLFYRTSEEKELCIEQMKLSKKPLIIVGASLYEGLDLKDDLARFNILIKIPYPAMSDYVKRKMERYPYWYERVVLEKIEQAIGRTNRHKNDWSKVYCLDSGFEKMLRKLNKTSINSRLTIKRI